MAEYLLTSSIEPIEKGQEFAGQLPLHVTVQQWFELDGMKRPFTNSLQNLAASMKPFEVTAGEEAMFGVDHDTRVRRLKKIGSLALLHRETSERLERCGGVLRNPEWANDGFNPHVTYVAERGLNEGEVVTLRTIELIKRDQASSLKTVEFVLPFSAEKR